MGVKIAAKKSVEALNLLLQDVIARPEGLEERSELIHALRSQQNMAGYSNQRLEIVSCSINTMKRNADQYLLGGFEALEKLRCQAKTAVMDSTKHKSTKKSKALLNDTIMRLEAQISINKEDLAALTWLLTTLLSQGRNYADQAGGSVVHLCKKEQSELLAMLGHRKTLAAYLRADASTLMSEVSSLTWLFRKSLSQAKKYAQEAGTATLLLCEREQSELLAMIARAS